MGVDIYWLEQGEADVPQECDWLSSGEASYLETLRFPKRRSDWRLGRWTAKLALAWRFGLELGSLAAIEIRPDALGAPEAYYNGQPMSTSLSLSHRAGIAVCACAGADLGCDLEVSEPHSDAFVTDYFTPGEQECVAKAPVADRSPMLALLWSAKESALKAMRTGLRADTRSVDVKLMEMQFPLTEAATTGSAWMPTADGWRRLQIRHSGGSVLQGWWRSTKTGFMTIVGTAPTNPPTPIPDCGKEWKCG
jgi:4'-phosphopantetheinyl transferase